MMTFTKRTEWFLLLTCCGALGCPADPAGSGASQASQTSEGSGSMMVETGGATSAGATEGPVTTSGSSSTGGPEDPPDVPDMPGMPLDPNDQIPPPDAEGCHGIYAQDLLPTFEVTVAPEVWAQLETEWNHGQAAEDAGINPNPYHPLAEFKYGDIRIDNASIRLRGNPTYWTPLPGDKMQFQIGFHTEDKAGHFLGIKRLVLESATYNRHMLRDRLSLAFMRAVGVRAPCANNARLVVNGEYYGIFTNIEKLDEVFLKRTMEDPSGPLWERTNWEEQANVDSADEALLEQLKGAKKLKDLEAILDIEQALRTYAAEAVIPDSDGAWAGGLNYYLYFEPTRGKFMLLPWDLDNTFERFNDPPGGEYPANPDPYTWEKPANHGRPWYDMSLKDPEYFARYIDILDTILHEGYAPAKMLGWIDAMSAQIEEAVLTDPNKPYDNETYHKKVKELREYVQGRYDFVDDWLVCWQTGGKDDGSGHCEAP